jgi:hypothetical protein
MIDSFGKAVQFETRREKTLTPRLPTDGLQG